jgi:hypothetical protein
MSVMRSIFLVGGLGLGAGAVVGCGAPFSTATGTGGGTGSGSSTSSSSSSSATSTSSSGSSTSSSTSSSSGGQACDGSKPCKAGAYCYFPDCSTSGTCVDVTSEKAGTYAPVCGCSGETYWNGLVAIAANAAIQSQGPCDSSGHECMPGSTECQVFGTNAYCDVMVTGTCPLVAPKSVGTCWLMPATCDASPAGHACGSPTTCQTACALIEGQQPWVQTSCTP